MASSVVRTVTDGILFKIAVSIGGQQKIGLIDSGASRCYMSPEIAAICELQLNPEILHLELADGSKVQSTQKADNVNVVVGKSICRVSFTVIKLLKDVALVLGVNWLSLWNPVIDWREEKMHIWTGTEWSQVQGMLLDSKNNIGTIKDFVYYSVDSEKQIPDFTVMKDPQFWVYHTDATNEWKRAESSKKQDCIISTKSRQEPSSNSFNPSSACKNKVQNAKAASTVQKKVKNECIGEGNSLAQRRCKNVYDVQNLYIWHWFDPNLHSKYKE